MQAGGGESKQTFDGIVRDRTGDVKRLRHVPITQYFPVILFDELTVRAYENTVWSLYVAKKVELW